MLQSILSLDVELLIMARGLVGPEYAILIQILGESIVIAGGIFLVVLWLTGVKNHDDEYKKNSLRIFATILMVFIIYSMVNFGIPQWRPSPIEVAGGIKPLIPHPIDNSFPSGHALFSAALLVWIWRYFRKCWLLVLFTLLALITTVSRVIGWVHYLWDILGGLFFGSIGAFILVRYVITLELFERRVYPFFIRVAGWIKL